MKTLFKDQTGYIALTSLAIVGVVVLAIGLSVVRLSLEEAQTALSTTKGIEVESGAESCLEDALIRLRDDATYSGGTVVLDDVSCTISVTGGGGQHTVTVVATLPGPPSYTHKIRAVTKRVDYSINILERTKIE